MVSFKTIGLLGLAIASLAKPVDRRELQDSGPPASSIPSVTATAIVTVTATGTATATATAAPAPSTSIEIVTVVHTVTQTRWTSTAQVTAQINCTARAYVSPSAGPTSAAPPVVITTRAGVVAHQKRQNSTSILPAPLPPVVRTRTRTVYTVTTTTEPTPYFRTRYQCSTTLKYDFTVDATKTVTYSTTVYASTATATSQVTCPGIGGFPYQAGGDPGGGFGGFGGLGGLGGPAIAAPTGAATRVADLYFPAESPTPKLAITLVVGPIPALPSPATVYVAADNSSSTATPLASTAAPATPEGPVIITTTLHLTNTAYTLQTINKTEATTVTGYACSQLPYDVTVTREYTTTSWTARTTITSIVSCPVTGPTAGLSSVVAPASEAPLKRQTTETTQPTTSAAPSPTPTTIHRTSYIQTTITVVPTSTSTRVIYACSPAAEVTPSASATAPATPT